MYDYYYMCHRQVATYMTYLYEFILYYIVGCKYDQILLYIYKINNNNYLLYYTNI